MKLQKRDKLLVFNAALEGLFGVWMLIMPAAFKAIASINMPLPLIQAYSLLALAISIYSWVASTYLISATDKVLAKKFIYTSIIIYHLAVCIGISIAAINGDTNFVGLLIHVPLVLIFILGYIKIPRQKSVR